MRLFCAIVEKEAPGLAEGIATAVQATCYGDPSSDCLLLLQHCGLHSAAASVTVRNPPPVPPYTELSACAYTCRQNESACTNSCTFCYYTA